MFAFNEKHLAAAVLHPLYRRLAYATAYFKTIAHSYIRQQMNEILGLHQQQYQNHPRKNINRWKISPLILKILT